jgi:hypothetical protein
MIPAPPLERFRAKWVPVRVKKTRQNKELVDNFRKAEPRIFLRGSKLCQTRRAPTGHDGAASKESYRP